MKRGNVRRLTVAALMGAVAFVLQYFSFSIPVLSAFAELDLSALPELIGGFILGPVGAVMIVTVKLLLYMIFKGTSSMYTGEIQNFLLSCAYVLPAVLYYRKHRTKQGALVGIALGSIVSVVASIFTNLYLIFPAYMFLYGMSWNSILEICAVASPWIKDIPTFVAFSVVPFNLVSRAVTSVLTMLLYKRISVPLKKMIQD